MARPIKEGFSFFPLDVDFFEDEKIQFVSARFGLKGEAIAIRLLCKIFRQGYYINFDEDATLLFARSVGDIDSHGLLKDVVNELLKRGFFERSIFERFGILTSKGIQKRYLKICKDSNRISSEINPNFDLIKCENYVKSEETIVKSEETAIKSDKTLVKSDFSTQSKVKKRKEKNLHTQTRENENSENFENSKNDRYREKGDENFCEKDFIEIWTRARLFYDKQQTHIDKLLTFERQNFNNLLKTFSEKQFIQAVAGLFFQQTVPAVRVRPDWLLKPENFEKMLDCWLNNNKLFEKPKEETKKPKFQKGDI